MTNHFYTWLFGGKHGIWNMGLLSRKHLRRCIWFRHCFHSFGGTCHSISHQLICHQKDMGKHLYGYRREPSKRDQQQESWKGREQRASFDTSQEMDRYLYLASGSGVWQWRLVASGSGVWQWLRPWQPNGKFWSTTHKL
jgi:hypothetical protein